VFASLIGGNGVYALTPGGRFVWGGYYEPRSLIWRSRWTTLSGIAECREALAHPGNPGCTVLLRRYTVVEGQAPALVLLVAGTRRQPCPPARQRRGVPARAALAEPVAAGPDRVDLCGRAAAAGRPQRQTPPRRPPRPLPRLRRCWPAATANDPAAPEPKGQPWTLAVSAACGHIKRGPQASRRAGRRVPQEASTVSWCRRRPG